MLALLGTSDRIASEAQVCDISQPRRFYEKPFSTNHCDNLIIFCFSKFLVSPFAFEIRPFHALIHFTPLTLCDLVPCPHLPLLASLFLAYYTHITLILLSSYSHPHITLTLTLISSSPTVRDSSRGAETRRHWHHDRLRGAVRMRAHNCDHSRVASAVGGVIWSRLSSSSEWRLIRLHLFT